MDPQKTFLVFGATGQTGRHFVAQALERGDIVRALARDTTKLPDHPNLDAHQGSVPDVSDLDALLDGVDAVAVMLGDAAAQRTRKVNTEFVQALVPAMRRTNVMRLLYQAGGLSAAPGRKLPVAFRIMRRTVARSYAGQHEDNEAVMRYLTDHAPDVDWVVHRAGIRTDGPSKGILQRSQRRVSMAPFRDVAAYNHQLLTDDAAIHTCDLSAYPRN